jgi:hypothetical protein
MVTLLVFGELNEVAQELLERSDLDVRWAMTIEEALAATRSTKIDLVLSSDPYALAYLEQCPPRRPPCVVVVGAELSEKAASYLAKGAMVVVPREAGRISEALSELTGLSFRLHPRMSLETVLDVEIRGESMYLTSIDLSASGIAVAGIPEMKYGETARITFDMLDRPMTATAMVVRRFSHHGVPCAGMCFVDMSPDDRQQLCAFIDTAVQQAEPLRGTLDLHPGDDTRDLMSLLQREADRGLATYFAMLSESVNGNREAIPAWLLDVAHELTETELESLAFDRPAWARTAVGMRIVLREAMLEGAEGFDATPVIDLCWVMAFETLTSSDEAARDATLVRAQLLRDVSKIRRAARSKRFKRIASPSRTSWAATA